MKYFCSIKKKDHKSKVNNGFNTWRDAHVYQRFNSFQSFFDYRSGHVVLTEKDLVSDQFRLVVVDVPHCDVHLHKRLQTYNRQVVTTSECVHCKWTNVCAGTSVTGCTGEGGRFRWVCGRGERWGGSISPRADSQKISQKKRPRRWDMLPTAILTSSHVAITLVT